VSQLEKTVVLTTLRRSEVKLEIPVAMSTSNRGKVVLRHFWGRFPRFR